MPDPPTLSRRALLATAGTLASGPLAGCRALRDGGGETTVTPVDVPADTRTTVPLPPSTLTVAHPYDRARGSDAMGALLRTFGRRYPNVDLDAVPSLDGAPTAIEDGAGPNVWYGRPGATLRVAAQSVDLLALDDTVWTEAFDYDIPGGTSLLTVLDTSHVAVPLELQRLNCLFYNPTVLETAGVDPRELTRVDRLFDALEAIASETDATPLAQSTGLATALFELWETILLAALESRAAYLGLTSSNVQPFAGEMRRSLDLFDRYLNAVADEFTGRTPARIVDRLAAGDVALTRQPTTAAPVADPDAEYGTDWDVIPFPATEGFVLLDAYSFQALADAPSRDATLAFLRYVGATETQARYCRRRGAIPARTSVDPDRLSPFYQVQAKQYRSSFAQLGSISRAIAVAPSIRDRLRDVIVDFRRFRDVGAAYYRMYEIFASARPFD
jgi:glucose/mannose transport system substrate-binding protein